MVRQKCSGIRRSYLGKENIIRLTEGTHEKVMMIDGRYIVIGSWNWLSHGFTIAASAVNSSLMRFVMRSVQNWMMRRW